MYFVTQPTNLDCKCKPWLIEKISLHSTILQIIDLDKHE